MSNINSQTNDIYSLSGVEDLSCDTAANIQGGDDLVVYRDKNLKGWLGSFNFGTSKLSLKADNQISSVYIRAGRWSFFEDSGPFAGFGRATILGPGKWNFTTLNEKISSIRRF